MSVLRFAHVFASYEEGKDVLKDVSFSIEEGEFVSIIGHNGSGKSTLAKLAAGLLETEKGEIYIYDELLTPKSVTKLRKIIGIVFQNPDNQFIGASVEDDIAFGLENQNITREVMVERVKQFASLTGMDKFLDKEPQNLSGGQKQRVAIAGVLAMNPDILILDEATAMLDPKGRKDMMDIVFKLRKDKPTLTIILITHEIEETLRSDRIIALNDGELYLEGTPNEVYKKEDKLIAIDLDIPFLFKMKKALKEKGIDVDDVTDLDDLARYLCQLNV